MTPLLAGPRLHNSNSSCVCQCVCVCVFLPDCGGFFYNSSSVFVECYFLFKMASEFTSTDLLLLFLKLMSTNPYSYSDISDDGLVFGSYCICGDS